ncbi:MAG: hypothetical protein AVDCRST_MAG78-415 [uncultured Rubrobacteraceae bacterium]|uniref:DoxX family protein n=1 Tax=uncultured Rubrobacteraceae bacterium TaxID=349277 RepID=A0A6J4PBM1_9ACTN|nr:MAG: hypothetical protein AVDCRST_MAG78-415 [uncultured Rubrobacteraceae bacterium]
MDKDQLIRAARRWGPRALVAMLAGSGVIHFVRPGVFTPIVPRVLPNPVAIVYASGAAEFVCAAGLARGARWAAPASAALLVAVLPANIQMALDVTARLDRSESRSDRRKAIAKAIAAWARVPMQIPLIWAALQAGRRQ